MRLLLDTHAFLWWITNGSQLSGRARAYIEDGGNTLLLSAASIWEIAIKFSTGRLALTEPLVPFIQEEMATNNIEPLAISLNHALLVHDLPPLHRDPFDRMLVAQAQWEKLPILTVDKQIWQYDVETIW